jgi:hypothetical protein
MNNGALPDKTRDAARQWARRAVLGIVRESGGLTVARPVFRDRPDLDLTIMDADAMTGLECAAKLTFAVRRLVLDYARQAREEVHSWQEIGVALGFSVGTDSEGSVADAAYDCAAGTTGFGRASFAWVCSACRSTVIDRGPQGGHPADTEEGHADDCQRLAAEIAAWNASREAEDTQ